MVEEKKIWGRRKRVQEEKRLGVYFLDSKILYLKVFLDLKDSF